MPNNSEDIIDDFIKAIMIVVSIFGVLYVIVHYVFFSFIFVVLIGSIFVALFVSVKGYEFSRKHVGRWIDLILAIFFGWLAWSSWLKGDIHPNYNGWLVALGWLSLFVSIAFLKEFFRKKDPQL